MKTKLTKEEKSILDSFERDEWIPVANLAKRKKELAEYEIMRGALVRAIARISVAEKQ